MQVRITNVYKNILKDKLLSRLDSGVGGNYPVEFSSDGTIVSETAIQERLSLSRSGTGASRQTQSMPKGTTLLGIPPP
jgi:hypothetical protein